MRFRDRFWMFLRAFDRGSGGMEFVFVFICKKCGWNYNFSYVGDMRNCAEHRCDCVQFIPLYDVPGESEFKS